MKLFNSAGKEMKGNNFNQFLTVKNETSTSADLYFYGDIVSDWWGAWEDTDQYPEAIRDFLQAQGGKNLNIYVNSGGGSVFAGLAIYNMLKRHTGFKTVYVDGMAASIASIIALAGDKIIIPSNAFIMIHKPLIYCEGNAIELREMAAHLDTIEVGITNVYRDHLMPGVDIEDIKKMVEVETWLNGEEAAKYFRTEIGTAKEYAAKITDTVRTYAKIPSAVINSAQAANDKKSCNDARKKIKRLTIGAISKGAYNSYDN